MSTSEHAIPVRSARDRIIDFLEIGDTYLLTDLHVVVADQPKVPIRRTTMICIENAQFGVIYRLCDPEGNPIRGRLPRKGKNATLKIRTPPILANITYRVQATKQCRLNSTPPPQSWPLLDESASVQVGIDRCLAIKLLEVPLLDPTLPDPRPSDPRIVAYGTSVVVQVDETQEGVQYSLILNGDWQPATVCNGNLSSVLLHTGPMTEDVKIQVRATKVYPADTGYEDKPLHANLYLKVMANPALTVSADPSAILDYQQAAVIHIGTTQAGIQYRAYIRPISDADFVHGHASGAEIVTVLVAGEPDAQVRKPVHSDANNPLGDGPVRATGGDLGLPVPPLTEDVIIIVEALKEHHVDVDNPDSPIITSKIFLDQVAVLLVRPDPARALTLRLPVIEAQTGDTMQVSGGQPGVFYYFRRLTGGDDFPLPAYFHKRDDQDAMQNKGVGQLGVEIDFVIVADPDVRPGADRDLARVFPRPPLLDITPFAAGTSLACRAVKAQTKVHTTMALHAQVGEVPEIRADPEVIDYSSPVIIRILESSPEDQYQVFLEGASVEPAVMGNGTDLAVVTEPLTTDAVFEVVVIRQADLGMRVERVVPVLVLVRPNTTLSVSAVASIVARNTGTEILIQQTQRGVDYQLMSNDEVIGSSIPGNGTSIALPTGPISSEAIFAVAATRIDHSDISVVLDERATVKLEPGA